MKELKDEAELFGDFGDLGLLSDSNNNGIFNLSATRQEDNLIQYQIYQGDINTPTKGIRFASTDVSSFDSNLDFVNNIKDIIDSSNNGDYGVEENNGYFTQNGAGVLGLAINNSIRFVDDATNPNAPDGHNDPFDQPDILEITQFGSQPTTKVPEPSTILASLFAFAFGGKFLGKYRKNKA